MKELNYENLFEFIKKLASDEFGFDGEFTNETTYNELALDSLDVVYIVMAIEDEFSVVISDEFNAQFNGSTTVKEALDVVIKNAVDDRA